MDDGPREDTLTVEQRIDANPEDFEARRQLVTYYRTSSKVAWDKKVPGLRRHALWLIEHHPEHDVQAPALSPQFDPEGFSAAKKLWEAYLARPDVSPFLVFRAASFFAPHDKPYAEQLILRGMAMDPARSSVRDKLEATTDAQLLARVGQILTRPNSHTKDPVLKQAPDQIRALGPTHCRSTTSRNINMRRRVPVNDSV